MKENRSYLPRGKPHPFVWCRAGLCGCDYHGDHGVGAALWFLAVFRAKIDDGITNNHLVTDGV